MGITVKNLTKRYGSQRAVDDISFTINTGEVVGFLGPNGAGKSTTIRMLTCYMAPTAGTIHLDNLQAGVDSEKIKQRIGYLPESNPLYADMAIVDYLRFCGSIQGLSKAQLTTRVREMIDICGLKAERYKKISELSKGYKQRVGLAQALIHDPDILILDEPTSGLDPNQIVEIRKLIKDIGKSKTVIMSSHILSEVEATCDRILIINRGKLVADGQSNELQEQAQGQELINVKIEAPDSEVVTQKLLALASVEKVTFLNNDNNLCAFRIQSKPKQASRKAVFDACVQNKWYILEMGLVEKSLENVFRTLTK